MKMFVVPKIIIKMFYSLGNWFLMLVLIKKRPLYKRKGITNDFTLNFDIFSIENKNKRSNVRQHKTFIF